MSTFYTGRAAPPGAALPSHFLGQQDAGNRPSNTGAATLPGRPQNFEGRAPWMRCEGVYCVQQGAASADLLGVRLARHLRCPPTRQAVPPRRQHAQRLLRGCCRFLGVSALIDVFDSRGSTRAVPSWVSATVSGGMVGCRHLSISGVLALRLLQ